MLGIVDITMEKDRVVENIILAAKENARLAYIELEERKHPGKLSTGEFNLKEYWLSINTHLDSLISEVTRLTHIFDKRTFPVPQLEETVKKIEGLYTGILSEYYNLPKDQGKLMRKKFKMVLLKLVDSLQAFFASLKQETSKDRRVHFNYYIWEFCEEVKQLPQNNVSAIIQDLDEGYKIIVDGLQDLDEELKTQENGLLGEEIDNSECWNNQERQLLSSCVALLKASRYCYQQVKHALLTYGHCNTAQEVSELDILGKAVSLLNLEVDEFITAVFPPMNRSNIQSWAQELVDHLQELLLTVRGSHYITLEDQTWVGYLLKDVHRSNNKLQPLFDGHLFY